MVAGTTLNLMLTVFLAYPLSRKDLRGLAVIGIFVLIPMFFRGGIVPTFLLVNSLGLVNTRWAVILPAGLSIWNTIVARTYFANLPRELTEASEIDGCSDFRFFAQIVLPLSRPILAVLVLCTPSTTGIPTSTPCCTSSTSRCSRCSSCWRGS